MRLPSTGVNGFVVLIRAIKLEWRVDVAESSLVHLVEKPYQWVSQGKVFGLYGCPLRSTAKHGRHGKSKITWPLNKRCIVVFPQM